MKPVLLSVTLGWWACAAMAVNLPFHEHAIPIEGAVQLGAYESLHPYHWSFGIDCATLVGLTTNMHGEGDSTRLVTIDIESRRTIHQTVYPFESNGVAFDHRNGRYFAIGKLQGKWFLEDFLEGRRLAPLKLELRRSLMPLSLEERLPKWLRGFNDTAATMDFDPSGKHLVVVYASGNLGVYDLENKRLTLSTRSQLEPLFFRGHRMAGFNHDGSLVIDVRSEGASQVFTSVNDGPRATFQTQGGMHNRFPGLVTSPFSNHFFTIQEEEVEDRFSEMAAYAQWRTRYQLPSGDRTRSGKYFVKRHVELWNIEEGESRAMLPRRVSHWVSPAEEDYVPALAFTSADHYLRGFLDGRVEWIGYDPAHSRSEMYRHSAEVTAIAYHRPTRAFVSGDYQGEIIVGSLDGTRLVRLKGNHDPIFRVMFSPDGEWVMVSTFNELAGDGLRTKVYVLPTKFPTAE